MSKGAIYPSESSVNRDPQTDVSVRQITSHPSIHHHPFFYVPAHDDAMRWLVFVSHRTGSPQLFVEERSSGRLIQLTSRNDLNEWSIHPSHDGRFVYFTAGTGAWRVNIEGFAEECLADFGDVPMLPHGMVGQAMGTTALSRDDRWWAVPVKAGSLSRLHIIDTQTGYCKPILEQDLIGHPQFHPQDANLLRYIGPAPSHEWLWILCRDGTGHRQVFRREDGKKQWLVHSIWNPIRREVLAIDWPHGMFGVDIDTGAVRQVCHFNAWHAMVAADGRQAVCDTTWPDRGLQLFDPQNGPAPPAPLCLSQSSNAGHHWHNDHCPYDDGPVEVYAPQHTHPHPNFSPDSRYVIFTSDRTGHAQLYEACLTEHL
jgi:oligogalacturonide lyase